MTNDPNGEFDKTLPAPIRAPKTMADLAQDALAVQSASNLSGVIHSFSANIQRLRELMREAGGDSTIDINSHPMCVIYATQIAHLMGHDTVTDGYRQAYDWAEKTRTGVPVKDRKIPCKGDETDGVAHTEACAVARKHREGFCTCGQMVLRGDVRLKLAAEVYDTIVGATDSFFFGPRWAENQVGNQLAYLLGAIVKDDPDGVLLEAEFESDFEFLALLREEFPSALHPVWVYVNLDSEDEKHFIKPT